MESIPLVLLKTPLINFLSELGVMYICRYGYVEDLIRQEELHIASRLNRDLKKLHPIKFHLANGFWINSLMLLFTSYTSYISGMGTGLLSTLLFFLFMIIMVLYVPGWIIKYCLGNYKEHTSVEMKKLIVTPTNFDEAKREIKGIESSIYDVIKALADNPQFLVYILHHPKSFYKFICVQDGSDEEEEHYLYIYDFSETDPS